MRRRYIGAAEAVVVDYTNTAVGDILCSDLSTVQRANYSGSGKTAIGVVSYNSGTFIEAINLTNFAKPFGGNTDIANLANCTTEASAFNDLDGTANTNALIAALGSSTDYAAGFCRSYSTAGTSAGDWDYPTAGQFKKVIDNRTSLNLSLTACSAHTIAVALNMIVYSVSTEYGASHCWHFAAYYGVWIAESKSSSFYIRPIIKITY